MFQDCVWNSNSCETLSRLRLRRIGNKFIGNEGTFLNPVLECLINLKPSAVIRNIYCNIQKRLIFLTKCMYKFLMIFKLNSDYFTAKIWQRPLKWIRSAFSVTYKLTFYIQFRRKAGPTSRAVWGVGLLPLACWDCSFESPLGHGCLSLVRVLCSQVDVSAAGWSLV
jgi:hypothetical protein